MGYGGRVLGARGLREQATSRDLNKGRTRLLKALEDVSGVCCASVRDRCCRGQGKRLGVPVPDRTCQAPPAQS